MSGQIIRQNGTALRPQAFHPGEMLGEELQARSITQARLAQLIKVSPSIVSEIIKGKRSITADFACRLEAALATPSYMWVSWQAEYDLQSAQKDVTKVSVYEEIRKICASLL